MNEFSCAFCVEATKGKDRDCKNCVFATLLVEINKTNGKLDELSNKLYL